MDITKNGTAQYGELNQKYTKTGQLISNESPIVLDKNSPIIQFENDYVKSKMVQLFGGQVIAGEITEQEAALVSNEYFNEKCNSLFKNYTEKISFEELKYFSQVIALPHRMFESCKISSIKFPKNLKCIKTYVFLKVQFDNTNFIIPNSVTSLGINVFGYTNLKSITGNNIIYTYGNVVYNCPKLEEINLPKLQEVKLHKQYPNGLILFSTNPKLKILNLPEFQKFEGRNTKLFLKCPALEEVICPKLQTLAIKLQKDSKVNKIILGNKINKINCYYKEDSVTAPAIIKFGFNDVVQIIYANNIFTDGNLTRYYNNDKGLPIPVEDLSNVIFLKNSVIDGMAHIPNTYSKIKISTETFEVLKDALKYNYVNTNLGFSEIHIIKSKSKKIKKFTLGNSACLQKLFLETDIKEIDDLAFKYCPTLEEVHLNPELEKIGSFAFAFRSNLYPSTYALPGGKVHYLQSFNIPKNVHTIGDNPLLGQEQLTKATLTLDPENKNFILEDGILYNKDKSKIILATCDVQIDRIPDTVTEIGAGAFAFNKYTGELTIPSSVKKIGYLAFAYSKFSSIKFEDNIDNITFEKTGNDILYIFNTVQNETLSNFYGMNNPSFFIGGRVANNQELNILKLNANINQNDFVRVTLPNTLYSEDFDLVVPVGIKACTYKKINDTYVKSKTYEEGKVIPKGEAVTLEGEQGEYIFPVIKNQIVEKDKDNILIGTDKDIEGNGKYYIFNNGSIELSNGLNLIKENTVYIKED